MRDLLLHAGTRMYVFWWTKEQNESSQLADEDSSTTSYCVLSVMITYSAACKKCAKSIFQEIYLPAIGTARWIFVYICSMCIHMHMHMYIHMQMRTYLHIHILIHKNICIYIYILIHIHVHIHAKSRPRGKFTRASWLTSGWNTGWSSTR